MRLPSAGGAGGGGHCYRYAVPGALFSSVLSSLDIKKTYEDETRHPSTGGTDGGGGC